MIAGPVFRLEVLTIGRRTRYFITRVVYTFGLLVALWLSYLEVFPAWRNEPHRLSDYSKLAELFFASFAGIQMGLILLVTPAMTAGTIAVEHERRTIDYLLTTQLSDSEITLSKFLARMAAIVVQLLVGLPVMLLVMLFGGIRTQTILEVFGYSLCVLLATASLSLWISATSRNSRSAITTAYLAVIALGAIPPAVAGVLTEGLEIHKPWVVDACAAVIAWNPVSLIVFAFDPPQPEFDTWYDPIYIVPVYLGATLVWLTLAVFAVRRTYVRAAGVGAAKRNWLTRANLELSTRRRKVGSHAMLWKELVSQQRALRLGWIGRLASLLLFGGAYTGLVFSIWFMFAAEQSPYGYWNESIPPDPYGWLVPFHWCVLHRFSVFVQVLGGSFVLLLVAARAAGSITVEREQDSWITLISTPLEARSIAIAKIVGAIYSVRYWYLFFILIWICCSVRYPPFAFIGPVLLLSHLIFAWLCAAIGVFFSVRCKTSLRAIGSALATVVIAGGGAPLLLAAMVAYSSPRHEEPMALGFVIPVALGGIEYGIVTELSDFGRFRPDNDLFYSTLVAHVVYAVAAAMLTGVLESTFDAACGRLAAPPAHRSRESNGPLSDGPLSDEGPDAELARDWTLPDDLEQQAGGSAIGHSPDDAPRPPTPAT